MSASKANSELATNTIPAPKCSNVNNNNSARSSRVGSAVSGAGQDMDDLAEQRFGWCGWQPQWLQRFCTAKWALFWLCWGGALQGERRQRESLPINSFKWFVSRIFHPRTWRCLLLEASEIFDFQKPGIILSDLCLMHVLVF